MANNPHVVHVVLLCGPCGALPGMANNPRSEERAWEVGRRLAEALGCIGEPGKLLPCLQVTSCNHFNDLCRGLKMALPFWKPLNTVPIQLLTRFHSDNRRTLVIVVWFCQSLGEDAFLPLPPREILNNGQVKANIPISSRCSHWT